MSEPHGPPRRGPRVLAAIALSTCLAGCGGGSDRDEAPVDGGKITLTQESRPDSLDPALSHEAVSAQALWLVYTPLLTYERQEGTGGSALIPGLAKAMPRVSADGRTYRLALREGLEYSDATKVRASDFEHAIKRLLSLDAPGARVYERVAGAEEFVAGGDVQADIDGIRTDDRTGEIAIELTEADPTFPHALALHNAGLVPGDTPFRDLTANPPAGVGPYEITASVPNRRFVLERVDGFAELGIDGVPAGHVDELTTRMVGDRERQTQDVLDGEVDLMQGLPPADLRSTLQEQFGPGGSKERRYEEHTTTSTYYFFVNRRTPPFDDPDVREAVNIGLDKPALARHFDGGLAPGCSFLPPGVPGYDEALDLSECPWGDPNAAGDKEAAARLIEDAGADGSAVSVYAPAEELAEEVAKEYAKQLDEIGLDAEVETVDAALYPQIVASQPTTADTGFASHVPEAPHPYGFFAQIDPELAAPSGEPGFGSLGDPAIAEDVRRLLREEDPAQAESGWGDLNRQLVESGALVPFGHGRIATFVSDRIDLGAMRFHPVYRADYTSLQLEESAE